MDKKKLIRLIRAFFVIFILSGIGTITDYYYYAYPQMFTKLFSVYDLFRLKDFRIQVPGVPLILLIVTISVFIIVIKHLYRRIVAEICKDN